MSQPQNKRIKLYFFIFSAAILIVFLGAYFIHGSNVSTAESEIENYTVNRKERIDKLKNQLYQTLVSEDAEFGEDFIRSYDINDCIIKRDSTISTFIYEDTREIVDYEEAYLNCLAEKCKNDVINERLVSSVRFKLDSINKYHSNSSDLWTDKMKTEYERFLHTTMNLSCDAYFSRDFRYSLKHGAFDDFSDMLKKIAEDQILAENRSIENESDFNAKMRDAMRQLNSEGKQIFNSRFSSEPRVNRSSFSYSGMDLGTVTYTHPITTYPNQQLELNLEYAISEQYRNNSLRTGSMPYAYCYGSSNSGASAVRVNAGNSDVLVMIKNYQGRVIRHAYISAHGSYRLNVPNGSYNVFFYYGKGWNPTKFMKETVCGTLKGGFHSNEVVDKDPSTLRVYNQIMTYTLTSVVNGNFNTTSSNKNEAF